MEIEYKRDRRLFFRQIIKIEICFDADRLDLMRVGITPDPAKMATEIGAYYAANPDIFRAEIQRYSELQRDSTNAKNEFKSYVECSEQTVI